MFGNAVPPAAEAIGARAGEWVSRVGNSVGNSDVVGNSDIEGNSDIVGNSDVWYPHSCSPTCRNHRSKGR